ncbi:MAG: DUF1947 domain-containing protein [Thermofilaceae archaeon]|nr:DUF1947 domain-containing protein [Thermofilaceae archaeon]MCX8180169.1 DUF1947 domain-containing protein [Thermofilaceae archaeon]MDW8004175.1 DUF1947 domain-containing protein [Thermofilaceae archaeon]
MFSSRYSLSKSDRKKLVDQLQVSLASAVDLIDRAANIEVARVRDIGIELIIVNGIPALVRDGNAIYPTLLATYRLGLTLATVIVDMGAVPHILNGADVMVPGIVEFGEFKPGDIVYVADINKRRVFAVGKAIISSEELRRAKKGKAICTLHYAGDKIWKLVTNLL